MAGPISTALNSVGGYQSEGLHDTGTLDRRAANVQLEKAQPSALHQIFDEVISVATPLAQIYTNGKKESASADYQAKRAEFDLGKISKQEFNDWMNNGDAWYKDNPYARSAARKDIGLQARHEADSQMHDQIMNGKGFASREEMQEVLKVKRQQSTKSYQEQFGIPEGDKDFLVGVGNQLEDSDIALNEAWSKSFSDKQRNADQNLGTANVNGIITDTSISDPNQKTAAIIAKQNDLFTNGIFSQPSEQVKMIQNASAQLATQPNGGVLVQAYGEQTVTINGQPVKVKDVLGSADYQIHVKTGDESTSRLNAKRQSEFNASVLGVYSLPLEEQDEALHKIETSYPDLMPTQGEQTEATNQLEQARAHINAQKVQKAQQLDEQNQKVQKLSLGETKMATQLQAALATPGGKFDYKNGTWYEGQYGDKGQAYRNTMNSAYDNIMSNDKLTNAEKTQQVMKLADVDSINNDGVISSRMKSTVESAKNELHSITATGDTSQPQTNLKVLSSLYEADPAGLRTLLGSNKDADKVLAQLDVMRQGGLTMDQMVKAEQFNSQFSDEEKKTTHKAVTDEIAVGGLGIPPSVGPQAETVYDYWYGATGGNKDLAMDKMRTYVRSNVTFFNGAEDDGDGSLPDRDAGGVPSHVLQFDGNTQSIDVNRQVIKDRMSKLGTNPDADDCIVETWRDGIHIYNTVNGQEEHWTRHDIEKMYRDRQKADAAQAAKELKERQEEALRTMHENDAKKEQAKKDAVVLRNTPVLALNQKGNEQPARTPLTGWTGVPQ